jgi:hypothetical protein
MARQKPADHLATLQKQRDELEAKLKEAKAKADAETKETQKRKNELAGALALKELAANPSSAFGVALVGLLNTGLTRAADRALFDLAPLPKAAKGQE